MLTYTEMGNQTNQLGPGLGVVRLIEEIDHDRIRATPEQGNHTSALGIVRSSREGGNLELGAVPFHLWMRGRHGASIPYAIALGRFPGRRLFGPCLC